MTVTSERLFGLSLFLVPTLLLTTKNGSVAVIGLMALLSIFLLIKFRSNIQLNKMDWFVVTCFCAYLFSVIPVTLLDGDSFRYFKGGSRILPCVLIYLVLRNISFNHIKMRPFVEWGVILGITGAFILALYQHFIEGRPRVDGFLYSINFGYLSCSLSLLALCLAKNSSISKLLYLCFFIGSISTLSTLTRGAIFAIPLLLILSLAINIRKIKPQMLIILTLIISGISVALYSYSPAIQQRLDYTKKEFTEILSGNIEKSASTGGRLQLWVAATEAFKYRPLVGSTHKEREQQLVQLHQAGRVSSWASGVPRGHAHNQYFEMAASGGILGILAFISMLFVPLCYFLRHSRKSDSAYVGAVFVAGFCIYCLTEVALQQNTISTFYGFMLAVLLTFTQQELAELKE